MSDFNSSVYINESALLQWRTELDRINSECTDILETIKNEVHNLTQNDVWSGISAESFVKKQEALLNEGVNIHDYMKDIDKFLENVVYTSKNQ